MNNAIRIGLLGCGTVGSAVVNILHGRAGRIAAKSGGPLHVTRIAVRDANKPRGAHIDPDIVTTDPSAVVADADVDIVVELMGGVEPAFSLVRDALAAGKHVVTANKELMAAHGRQLTAEAEAQGVSLLFEASVAGGIPIIRPLQQCLAANRLDKIVGIVNGTTNFMLTRMTEAGDDFAAVLAEAQQRGYAEADPTADVEGYDAAAKMAILASLAFDTSVTVDDVYCEGIGRITPADIEYGRELGYVVKLVGIARRIGADDAETRLDVRVHPAFIPTHHPLAQVNDVFNAVWVEGDPVGQLMFYGPGAGGMPTGSAVVADIIDAARHRRGGVRLGTAPVASVPVKQIEETVSRFYVSLQVTDRPGVLARIATAFGREGVSIESVIQKGQLHDPVDIVLITHAVREAKLRRALATIEELEPVHNVMNVIRVEAWAT